MRMKLDCAVVLATVCALSACGGAGRPDFEIRQGDHICLIGNTLADRMQHDGWLETLFQHRFADHELVFRNLGFSGDELTLRLRSLDFGSPDDHLRHSGANVIFAFFGYNESFAGADGLEQFVEDLGGFVRHTLDQQYDGSSAPRLVLFSPIAHEDLKSPDLPNGAANNQRLAAYTAAMAEVAEEYAVTFVDLFTPTLELFARAEEPLTINGIHLTEPGNRALAELIDESLFPNTAAPRGDREHLARIRTAVLDKNLHWFNRYRTTDGYSIYGARGDLDFVDGQTNEDVFNRELEVLDIMVGNRDERIWSVAKGGELVVDGSNTPPFLEVVTNMEGEGPGGAHAFLGGEEAISRMTVAAGMEVNLFASEEQFPELVNPNQSAVDTKGRLWVTAWASYPHWKPKDPMNDKLLILPDDDGDGRADRCIVFADGLENPTGFEFWGGGVLVAQVPDLLFLKDTDGDDRADVRIRVLHGLDSADTHHSINSFVLGPGGGLYFQEGTFHHTQVETPYGPSIRNANAGVYRYEPRTQKFDVYTSYGFANPHGHVFDRWGQDFVTDGTGSLPYYGTSFSGRTYFPNKHRRAPHVYSQRTRPCSGTAILSSGHFPTEMQGNWLVANVIGFQGILQYRFEDDGAGFSAVEVEPIVYSSDPNFRPTDMEIGADGALYFTEWQNPIIGHMQHNLRDPSRDRNHGRIYRVTYPSRPLLEPVEIAGAPVEDLVRLLEATDDNVRYRAKIELSARPTDQVIAAVRAWADGLDPTGGEYEHHMAEALWVHQYHNVVNQELLERMLRSPDYRARAAATRVLCHWRQEVSNPLDLLRVQVNDEHPRVRLEAVRACSFLPTVGAAEVALEATGYPLDRYLNYTLRETMTTLQPQWRTAIRAGRPFARDNPAGLEYILAQVDPLELVKLTRIEAVYHALLTRTSIADSYRLEALTGLAKANGTSALHQLVAAIERQGADSEGLADLCRLLARWDADELQTMFERLVALTDRGRPPLVREAAYAAWNAADGSPERAWEHAAGSIGALQDFLRAIPSVVDRQALADLYSQIRLLMFEIPAQLRDTEGRQEAPGVAYAYYESAQFPNVALATLDRLRPLSTGRIEAFGKDVPGSRGDGFALKLTAWLDAPQSGEYTFYTASDDGSRLYIDGRQVVDNDGQHGVVERSGVVSLAAGRHRIVVTYFDNGGRDRLEVSWQGPGFEREVIRADQLTVNAETDFRRSAIEALAYLPGHGAEAFREFANFIEQPEYQGSAIRSMLRIPRNEWPAAEARALAPRVLAIAADTPLSLRNSVDFEWTVELGQELAGTLPEGEADQLRSSLSELAPLVIRIRSVPGLMLFDKKEFTVVAGKPVRIVFENPDMMPHNLLIVLPGSIEEVGTAAERMGLRGESRNFRPSSRKILLGTDLVQYGESVTLDFVAPADPGDYGYLCTYPTHWRTMNGIMRVVAR